MPEVGAWFEGRSVLVTGATGFLGKVLLEKLLRSLPGLRTVYVLIRSKRGQAPAERIRALTKCPLFDELRRTNPASLERLQVVEGDILEPGLGLDVESAGCQELLRSVTVVFHCAALVRLEAGLREAVRHNTVATHHLLQLCRQMPNLESFVYTSTAFCHCEREVLEEKYYPPAHDPHDVMLLVRWLDDESLKTFTPKLLGPHPNSYTYSKRLAECLVYEASKHFPATICRPSIVTPVFKEPLEGWVDNLNGPVGLLVGAGKGVIRSMLCRPDFYTEIIPVDIAVNAIITAAWDTAVRRPAELPVYNLSTSTLVRVTWGEVLERGRQIVVENPFDAGVWFPGGAIRTSPVVHLLCVLLFHFLPAYLIDFLLLIALQKPFMVRLQRRISAGLDVLQYFTLRPWHFDNRRTLELGRRLSGADRELYYTDNVQYDVDAYLKACVLGARQYCLKEPLETLPRARRHLRVFYFLDCLLKTICVGFLLYVIYQYVRPSRLLAYTSIESLKVPATVGSFIS